MEKDKIKAKVREGLEVLGEKMDTKASHNNTDYSELQSKLIKQKKGDAPIFKQNQVMDAAHLGDSESATDRSLFSKKLRKEKNEEGDLYKFNKKELASLIKVVNNPNAFD